MAFANARMTQEEMKEFAAKAIPNPANHFFALKPYQWTIDREENVFLVWGAQEREEPHDDHFILGWRGHPLPVKLRSSWVAGDTRRWELLSIRIPEDLIDMRFEILQSLKDALTVYGFNGVPDDPFNRINAGIKVQFNF